MKGRPRKFDYDRAKQLRDEGHTYREIAKRLKVTAAAVQSGLKRMKRD